ncbi:hypothetical protein NHF46_14255 [Arthrobacter alpinus]|nr:hypothetical protein [Arthrobacter alpinus]
MGPDNPYLDKVASLAMNLRGADPEKLEALLERWLAGLEYDAEHGHYFHGGFSVEVQDRGNGTAQIVFTSGGQDVAESLGYAVDEFYEQVLQHLTTASVTWTEQPLEP